MIGQRVWELWPIISKPRPLQKYIRGARDCFVEDYQEDVYEKFQVSSTYGFVGKAFRSLHPMLQRPHLTDWDQFFVAAFGRHLYSTYQVLCLWVLPARHKLIKHKQ